MEWKELNFKLILAVVENTDPSGVQSQIPPKVLLINDIPLHFKCAIQDIGKLEMDKSLKELCIDGMLKPKHQHLEIKRFNPHFTYATGFPNKMDKIYSQSCAKWLYVVGTTYFNKQEDDPHDHWSSYVDRSKNDQNLKLGRTRK